MDLKRFLQKLETRLPPTLAFPDDKVGLQLGDPDQELSGVFVTLDVEVDDVLRAASLGAGLVLCHHPVVFEPMTHLIAGDRQSDVVRALVSAGVAVYVAHTNFDNSPWGMVRILGERLELLQLTPLAPPPRRDEYKVVTFVPVADREKVLAAMSEAGAGRIGDYAMCSFGSPGKGTFLGLEGTNPAIGESGKLEEVEETRLEMVVPRRRLPSVVAAMRDAHPYEEVAYDVYPMVEQMSRAQYVWRGRFGESVQLSDLVDRVVERISLEHPPRVTLPPGCTPKTRVQEVGVAPGGVSSALAPILASGLDVLVVGELGYHRHLEAAHAGMIVIEAGHAETERFFVPAMIDLVSQAIPETGPTLHASERYPL